MYSFVIIIWVNNCATKVNTCKLESLPPWAAESRKCLNRPYVLSSTRKQTDGTLSVGVCPSVASFDSGFLGAKEYSYFAVSDLIFEDCGLAGERRGPGWRRSGKD